MPESNTERVMVFIDGSNFYHGLKATINTYAEKGVDIQVAVDMLQLAFNKAYDTAILVSGDGDFASVVQAVKGFGRRMEVAYVTGRPAYHLRQVCDVFVELSVDLLRSLAFPQKQNLL
jgi:uncharacterized LabA/DUF88 family protein